jgi:hypothetical protein
MNRDLIYRQTMKPSGCRMANHSMKRKTHDSSSQNDNYNCIDSPRFYVIKMFPKGKPFNTIHHIGYIMQSILELHSEHVRHRLVIYADNARPHMIRQSQEFYKQNSLRIAPIRLIPMI